MILKVRTYGGKYFSCLIRNEQNSRAADLDKEND